MSTGVCIMCNRAAGQVLVPPRTSTAKPRRLCLPCNQAYQAGLLVGRVALGGAGREVTTTTFRSHLVNE